MHYFCEGGCGGHAGAPASCHAKGCPKKGETFTECDCGDESSHLPRRQAGAQDGGSRADQKKE